ncbi:hypothetical protein OPV22_006274 [Ensete ventricosum]|uniref:TmcB/TmcC TPR repeats domain-containing protein n=1 Tax=Ensete ventricosum TaxID=4639 RepID=A0AAV8RPC4_ENSVE|nr:hypothetical protein OPV22_006274 [Ensete ventricosum]
MTAAILTRSCSFLGDPRRYGDSASGISFLRRNRSGLLRPRSRCAAALHCEAEVGREGRLLRRARSEGDLVPSNRPAQVDLQANWFDIGVAVPAIPPVEQVAYSGGGIGKGRKVGGGRGGGGSDDGNDNRRIAKHYQQMLRSDPSNALLLSNYGKFLHEVEGDAKGAEEYYGRAILASPGDGEVLSLYGKLVWETHRDGERAEAYFERAVEASPDDCFVLGSYAHFLWDAEEEAKEVSSPLVEAL